MQNKDQFLRNTQSLEQSEGDIHKAFIQKDSIVVPTKRQKFLYETIQLLKSQLQESGQRQARLKRLNDQLTKFIQLCRCNKQRKIQNQGQTKKEGISSKKDQINIGTQSSLSNLISEENLQNDLNKQTQSLKLKINKDRSQFSLKISQFQRQNQYLKEEVSQRDRLVYLLKEQNAKIKEQIYQKMGIIAKLQKMIKNQEDLIEDFKIASEEQADLEREIIIAGYQQKELSLKKNYNSALKAIQENYMKKLKSFQRRSKKSEFLVQFDQTIRKGRKSKENRKDSLKDRQSVQNTPTNSKLKCLAKNQQTSKNQQSSCSLKKNSHIFIAEQNLKEGMSTKNSSCNNSTKHLKSSAKIEGSKFVFFKANRLG